MSGLSALVLLFFLLPLLLLCVPTTFIVKGHLYLEEQWVKVRFAWGLGLFSFNIEINGREKSFVLLIAGIAIPVSGKKSARKIKEKKVGKKKEKRKNGFNPSVVINALNRKLLTVVLSYIKKVIRSFRLRLQLSGYYGTDDPALTGILVWLIDELQPKHCIFELEPDFSRPIINLNIEKSGRIVPIIILYLTIRLLLAKPVRELWWDYIKKSFVKKIQRR